MKALAMMIAQDEDALVCDLAETYGIYDYRNYPPSKIAIFAWGLSSDSRIKMAFSGAQISLSQLIAAISCDKLANLVWMQSEDGQNRRNAPQFITPILLGKKQPETKSDLVTYDNPEEFREAMKRKYGG